MPYTVRKSQSYSSYNHCSVYNLQTDCQTKENRLPVSYVLQMSLYSTDVSRLWKYSSQSKHGYKHNCLPREPQQAQLHQEGLLWNAKWAQFEATAITLSNGKPCVMYQAFCSLTCRFPPETSHWSWKLSPSIFICQPDFTTQVGSTFVFLVVTESPGSRAPPVLFLGGRWLQGKWRKEGLFFLPRDFQGEFGGTLRHVQTGSGKRWREPGCSHRKRVSSCRSKFVMSSWQLCEQVLGGFGVESWMNGYSIDILFVTNIV